MNRSVEEGADVEYKAANGRICGFKRGCPSFRGFDIELNFFSVSPELIKIMTGSPVYYDFAGSPIGYDDCSIQCNSGFALELWAEVLGEERLPRGGHTCARPITCASRSPGTRPDPSLGLMSLEEK